MHGYSHGAFRQAQLQGHVRIRQGFVDAPYAFLQHIKQLHVTGRREFASERLEDPLQQGRGPPFFVDLFRGQLVRRLGCVALFGSLGIK